MSQVPLFIMAPQLRGEHLATFDLMGEPKPCPRPRARVLKLRRQGKLIHRAQLYMMPDYTRWMTAQGHPIRQAIRTTLAEPLCIRLTFLFPRPRAMPKGYTVARRFYAFPWPVSDNRAPYLGHADVDNLSKSVLDAMQRCRALSDDRLVVELSCSKWYVALGEQPHTRVEIYRGSW